MEEFGDHIVHLRKRHEHLGCGFRTLEQAHKWFMPEELDRLAVLGFQLVKMDVDRILAESEHQLVFARSIPLAMDVVSVTWLREI